MGVGKILFPGSGSGCSREAQNLSESLAGQAPNPGLKTRVVLIGLIKTTEVVLTRSI